MTNRRWCIILCLKSIRPSGSSHTSDHMRTFGFLPTRQFILPLVTVLAFLAASPSYALTDTAAPSLGRADLVASLSDSLPGPGPSLLATSLHLYPRQEHTRWNMEFTARPAGNPFADSTPASLLQRGEYIGSSFTIQTAMGDIGVSETTNTVWGLTGKGGKFGLRSGNCENAIRLSSFAATGASDSMVVGLSGEVTFLAESARLKSIYASGRERVKPVGKRHGTGELRGDVLGLVAVLEPFRGMLAAEAEVDFAVFDRDTADDIGPVHDRAYRVKAGGAMGHFRYSALHESTGKDYRLMGSTVPKRDREGIALGMGANFESNALDVQFSRYNNNTGNSPVHPRLYQYETVVDYAFSGFKALPVGMQYRKVLLDSAREPAGFEPKETDTETVSGRLNGLTGGWDLGLQVSYFQRSERVRDQREAAGGVLIFTPKFTAPHVAVAPDFSMKRSTYFPTRFCTDELAVGLGINGRLHGKLDYRLKGGFKREQRTDLPASGKETLGANLTAGYQFGRIFKVFRQPSLGIKGEYTDISGQASPRRNTTFSLLVFIDNESVL